MLLRLVSDSKPNRNFRRRQRTRDAILSAADRMFREKGVDDTTVADVTKEADIAYGSFYNHFKTMNEVVSAVAGNTLKRVADRTGEILAKADRVELLPCVGARVTLRILTQHPAARWLLERPHIFVEEFYKMAGPFMIKAERDAVATKIFRPAGGHECWLRIFPWLLIAELIKARDTSDLVVEEDKFALVSLRLLGVEEGIAPELVKISRKLVKDCGLTEPVDLNLKSKLRLIKSKSVATRKKRTSAGK